MKKQNEQLTLFCIDGGHAIYKHTICEGSPYELNFSMRSVLAPLFANNCFSFILVHNHPSGDCRPSESDENTTKKIQAAANLINAHFADHVILGRNSYYSFALQRIFEGKFSMDNHLAVNLGRSVGMAHLAKKNVDL
jgi:DNA repair protein RadC